MIIFLADGRLGNQIFQYVFLNTVKKNNETLIVSGLEDLDEVFEIDNTVLLNKKNRLIRNFLYRIVKPILIFLADKTIISSISINHEEVLNNFRREDTTYIKSIGFLKFITFVKLGFFQSEAFFNEEIANSLKIKDKFLLEAEAFLMPLHQDTHKVFIHIRRGDYRDYAVYGKSTLLPIDYYKEKIDWFLKNKENPFFIFLSDEPEFIEKEFSYIQEKLISSDNHYGTDLAIMTKCKSAILSPSSFGWWGSYLMKKRDVVFVPKYWLGFNSGIEYQSSPYASFFNKIDILKVEKIDK